MPASLRLHPRLINFGEEFHALAVRLLAYLCGVGALALIAADLFSGAVDTVETTVPLRNRDSWAEAVRAQPAFAAPATDFASHSESYEVLRHAEGGGRKDILRWSVAAGEPPLSQIEVYRPGTELVAFGPAASEVAARAANGRAETVQPFGVVATKFGPVALVGFSGEIDGKPRRCTGFAHVFEMPRLQISGWTCQADDAQTQRQQIACALDRLTMLSAGNDLKLAELFAHAELRRQGCSPTASPSEWMTAAQDPVLRGRL